MSRTLDIPIDHRHDYPQRAMTGCVRFYDAATRWGVVVADDGGLYMIQGQQLGAPFRDGERVRFEPLQAPGGPRATSIQRLGVFPRPTAGAR